MQGERRRNIDWILNNDFECEACVNDEMHVRSDSRPAVAKMEGEQPEVVEFTHKKRRHTRWTPTKTSATRIVIYRAGNIKGEQNLKHIQAHVEHIAKEGLSISKHKQQAIYRKEATPLTPNELHLSRLDERVATARIDCDSTATRR